MKMSVRMKAYWAIESLLYEAQQEHIHSQTLESSKVIRELEDLFLEVENILTQEERVLVKEYVTSKYSNKVVVSEENPERITFNIFYKDLSED